MKRNRRLFSLDTLMFLLVATCLLLFVLLAIANPRYIIVALIGVLLLAAVIVAFIGVLRHKLRGLLNGRSSADGAQSSGYADLPVPMIALENKRIVWYNKAFREIVMDGEEVPLAQAGAVVPGLDYEVLTQPQGQDLSVGNKSYTVYGNSVQVYNGLYFLVFAENTELKKQAADYVTSRPAVLYFVIDTYEEILKDLRESERTRVVSSVDEILERYIGRAGGFLRRVSASRYIAVVEEHNLQNMIEKRFDVLDAVRNLEDDVAMSLSIGVGHQADSFKECDKMAMQALNMALGRGGDQAAVYGVDGYVFYGGVSRSVEKRTKVKSRLMAEAIKTLVEQSDRVLVMGHKNSDMDSVGAAVGMLRFSKMCRKPAAIVIDQKSSVAGHLLDLLKQNNMDEDLLSPQVARSLAGPNTLLIIVDTHMKFLLESQDVYEQCDNVVVIDHHRQMVGHIDDAAVFYHEPYASSASELVTELLQYVKYDDTTKPTSTDAEALLAGITLDTRTFSLHVGVRTFEAAAYLRRLGAQTDTVKRLFSSSIEEYISRSSLVEQAEIHDGCAVVVSDEQALDSVVVAQAANDLLTIDGVKASFVALKQDNEIRISARSMGEVNVQIVMEKLGGGGHLTMAGAQIKGVSSDEAKHMLVNAIKEYISENKTSQKTSQQK